MAAVVILKGRNTSLMPSSHWVLWNLLKSGKVTNESRCQHGKMHQTFPSTILYFGFSAEPSLVSSLSLWREDLQIFYPHFPSRGWIALLLPRKRAHLWQNTGLPQFQWVWVSLPCSHSNSDLFPFWVWVFWIHNIKTAEGSTKAYSLGFSSVQTCPLISVAISCIKDIVPTVLPL